MIGKVVSHYKILEKLGEGGMGVVYKAEDTKLRRIVALKFLPPSLTTDPDAKERFIHEAQAASALDHPNICNIYEINETDDGQMYMAMACYEGETLKKKIESGPLPIDQCIGITTQVAHGLAKAHESAIVHRDIKPANIIVTKDGIAKILDFGLAKLSGRTLLTKTGTTMGTAAYMSPEQARSETVDARTDIWSLGVVLYEMLTGKRPFESEYEQGLVYSILNEEPRSMRELQPEVPEAIDKICRRSITKRVEGRYQSADEFLSDLRSYQTGTDLSRQTRRIATRRRKRLYAVLGAAVIIGATLLMVVFSGKSEVIDTVAVLPFANASKDPNLEWMCDGLTNEVIDDLCRTPGLSKVIAFSSVMEFKNKEVTLEEVRRRLGVAAVLVSRLYQHGDVVSVSIELLEAKDQTRLWGNEYTRKATEIRTLHRDIVLRVTEALNLPGRETAETTVSQPSTNNPDAYRLFLQGQAAYHTMDEKGLRRSIGLYRSALELDPNMATAYAGIASAYCQMGNFNHIPWAQAGDSARSAATRALSLNSKLADAHFALALVRYNDYERFAAEEECKLALRLNPLYADCMNFYADFLQQDGRFDDAIRLMKQATALEPLNVIVQYDLSTTLIFARRYDEGIREAQKVLDLDSTFSFAYVQLTRGYALKGQYDKAIDATHRFGQKGGVPWIEQWHLGQIDASMGRKDDARKRIRQLYQMAGKGWWDPGAIASIYAGLGEKDSAFAWLEKAFRDHSNSIFYIKVDPFLDSLRNDGRYVELLRKLGLSE